MAARFLMLGNEARHERVRHSPVAWAWLATAAGVLAWMPTWGLLPAWLWMWGLVAVLLAGHKAIAYVASPTTERLSSARRLAFLLGWPGLNVKPFLNDAHCTPMARRWFLRGAVNTVLGAAVVWGLARWSLLSGRPQYLVWTALVGLSLLAHFGLLQMLAAAWRVAGVPVPKLWDAPLTSITLAEFWSRRWNRAFHEFVRDHVCRPLRNSIADLPASGPAAMLAGFVYSGLVHELVLSLPAGGGYGLPTAYFALQGLGMSCQRRWAVLTRPLAGRLWTLAVVLIPLPLVFHEPFRTNVVLPFLSAIGAAG